MSEIEFIRDGHVARVRLNRPESLNAINRSMDERLAEIWADINGNPELWVTVLSAEGERAFCAGADVSGGTDRQGRMALGGGLTGVGGPLTTLRTPLIVLTQGHVVGGGMELALCGDLIVAADTSTFSMPETKVGIIGDAGIMHRAMRQLPYRVALGMVLTGERLKASDALQFGMVNEVVPLEDLATAGDRWVERILACSPLAVQAAKDAANQGLGQSLAGALGKRYEPIEQYASSTDVQEGLRAFAERRKPVWSGR